MRLNACASKTPIIMLDMNIAIIPSPFAYQHIYAIKNVTKENAILNICNVIDINIMDVIAFGDDLVDIGMLKICGKGIAMGNSVNEVKSIADVIIDSNDNDGIAKYLTETLLCSNSLL